MAKLNTELVAFEAEFDARVASLPLLKLPIRTVLSALYGTVDALFHGHRLKIGKPARPEVGAALASRLSYLTHLLLECPFEPLGSDALDAQSPLQESPELFVELQDLIQYGHFSELMPEAHRGYYRVDGDRKSGFVLTHVDAATSRFEEREVVLTELSLPFFLSGAPVPDDVIDSSIAQGGGIAELAPFVKARFEEVRFASVESPILTDAGFQKAVGCSYAEFRDFRAAWFAICEVCLALAAGFTRQIKRASTEQEDALYREFLEWTRVCLKRNFLLGLVQALTSLGTEKIESIMRLYSVEPGTAQKVPASDGFFPPFWRPSEDVLLFNPDVVRSMLSARNVPFALNRLDPNYFNDHVSDQLEPALVEEFRGVAADFNVVLIPSVKWDQGEIDVLVYESETNVAIQVQAKGAIPAQGARMVRAVEGRTREALEQLRQFRALTGDQRDSIISRAVGRKVAGATLIDVVLVRGGIGSWKVWADLGGAIPLNIPLLRAAIERAKVEGRPHFSSAIALAKDVLDELVQNNSRGWVPTQTTYNGVGFRIPLLSLNNEKLASERLRLAGKAGEAAWNSAAQRSPLWNLIRQTLAGGAPAVQRGVDTPNRSGHEVSQRKRKEKRKVQKKARRQNR